MQYSNEHDDCPVNVPHNHATTNLLALFDAIQSNAGLHDGPDLEQGLVDLAKKLGMTNDQIEDALYSDRFLVVYEP